MNAIDPMIPENWLVYGDRLGTRRRRAGADAQRGFDYQRAFAGWKIAELLKDSSDILAVRYEGAQDVDLLLADGQVLFVQLKDEPDETYPANRIAPILVGFALDLFDASENPRARFELVVHAAPGAPALKRLANRAATPQDRETYLQGLRRVPELAGLVPPRLNQILDRVLERITVHRGMGRHGGLSGAPIFSLLAKQALLEGQVAEEHIDGLLSLIDASLKGRLTIDKAGAQALASTARRLPRRIDMAPMLPSHYQPRAALIEQQRNHLLTDARVAITGLGGSGKTMLAQALARDPDVVAKYSDGVLWASFGQNPNIPGHLRAMLRTLNRAVYETGDVAALHAELNAALAGRTFLLVLDDLWDMAIGSSFVPPEGCGLLITSRQPRIARSLSMNSVEVDGLQREEAVALIEHTAGRITDGDRPAAEKFIERVGRLAFAVRLGALLIADGRSFARLVEDLDAEGVRLAALDVDQGDEQGLGVDRRGKSLEACLALSVAALGPALRTCFFQLAVLPEDIEIDPELAAEVFALDDVKTARERLFDLASRGLTTHSGPTYSATFRMHDLVLEYARTGFGPRRHLLVTMPESLPRTLPELHGQLIDRSRKSSPNGRWGDCQPDLYFDDHLDLHLIAAKRIDDLANVLRETKDGRATWLARQRQHQNTLGFLRFVRTCIVQNVGALIAQPEETPITALADMMTAAIAGATAARRAANIPAGLLGALVQAGELTYDDALTQASLCPHAQRAYHLLDLLPLTATNMRSDILERLISEFARTPLLLIGDREILDRLLPQLSESEVGLVEAASRSSPELESEFLWALARNAPGRIDGIIAHCRGSNERDIRETLLLLAADGLGGFEASSELIDTGAASRRQHVRAAALLALPSAELARHLTNANIAHHVLESWERYPARVSTVAIEAIWRIIHNLEPTDAARAAWMSARLMAIAGRADDSQIFSCATALVGMDDSDWRKADGLGWLLQVAPVDVRPRIAEHLLMAASKHGFHDLGAKRMKQIAAAFPHEHFESLETACDTTPPHGRAMVLAALLEHAPDEIWGRLSEKIYREARYSGQIGDIYAAAERIPGELLKGIWEAIDRVQPTPELVHAAAALSENIPESLTDWFAQSWAHLRAYERIRAAAGHSDVAALYADKQTVLTDLARASGLLNGTGEMLPLHALDAADGKRLLTTCTPDDYRRFLADNPNVVRQVADYQIANLLDWFGEGLTLDQIEALWTRVRSMTPRDRSTNLGRIGELLDDATAIAEAVIALLEIGSAANAAIWLVRYGSLTSSEDRDRLGALRAQDPSNREVIMLEVALFPYLDRKTQEQIELVFAQRRGLFPAFVASLDRSLYTSSMIAIFDQCLIDFAHAGPGSRHEKSWFSKAEQLLQLPLEVMSALYVLMAPDRTNSMAHLAAVLATAVRLDVKKLCEAITRIAPLLGNSLAQEERDVLAVNMVASAQAHSH